MACNDQTRNNHGNCVWIHKTNGIFKKRDDTPLHVHAQDKNWAGIHFCFGYVLVFFVVFFLRIKKIHRFKHEKTRFTELSSFHLRLQQMFGFYCWMRTFMVAIRQFDSSSICSQASFFYVSLLPNQKYARTHWPCVYNSTLYSEHKHIYSSDKAKIAQEFGWNENNNSRNNKRK